MKTFSENNRKQANLMNIEVREYFKFIKREFHCMKELSLRVEAQKSNFYKAQEKLMNRKDELFKKGDVLKWELDPNDQVDKNSITSNKDLAFAKMLPKDTETLKMLKYNYGFYLNRIIDLNGKNHSFAVSIYCQKHARLFADLQATLGEIIAFLGDGTYRKLDLVEDQKLKVKEKEKNKKKEEKKEEPKEEEKKE